MFSVRSNLVSILGFFSGLFFLLSGIHVPLNASASGSQGPVFIETKPEEAIHGMNVTHHHYSTVGSTQSAAKDYYGEIKDANSLVVVTADEQTDGIGMWGRSWVSPEGNVFATFCFRVTDIEFLQNLSMMAGVLMQNALIDFGVDSEDVFLRWINNVVIRGSDGTDRKIAGTLIGLDPIDNAFIVRLGIGVNVSVPKDVLESIDQPAMSLDAYFLEKDKEAPTVNDVVAALTNRLCEILFSENLSREHLSSQSSQDWILERYAASLAYVNQEVQVREPVSAKELYRLASFEGVEIDPMTLEGFEYVSSGDTTFATLTGIFRGVVENGYLLLEAQSHLGVIHTIKYVTGEIVPIGEKLKGEK